MADDVRKHFHIQLKNKHQTENKGTKLKKLGKQLGVPLETKMAAM